MTKIIAGTGTTAMRRYQQKCHREYADSVGLPRPYTYPDGNPIRPLPPVQITTGELMIVGAYPSARFEARQSDTTKRWRLVPVADNLQPFAEEQYFDGQQVRTLVSGDGLRTYLLEPLGMEVKNCWITDLVKVFLYKKDHVGSCGDVCPNFQVPMLRQQFLVLAKASLKWLKEECELCKPKLVVTLGQEVAQAVSGEMTAKADDLLNRPVCRPESIGGWPTLFLPHPDSCRRMEKWQRNMASRISEIGMQLGKG
jgi:uracil-DNA glycosylase